MTSTPARRSALTRALLCCAALASTLTCLPAAAADKVLRVSAIPDEAPTELQRKFAPLGDYLAKQTGREVVFVPVNDYAAVVEALAAGKLDMAWLGGFTYVQAHRRADKVVPLVQRQEDAQFTSKFITADVQGVIDRVPSPRLAGEDVRALMDDHLADHYQYTRRHGEDLPAIRGWRWDQARNTGSRSAGTSASSASVKRA